MTLDTLYKRTKTGAIQYWMIEVISGRNAKDIADDIRAGKGLGKPGVTIHKESGQLGTTNPTEHKEVISEGKNIGRSNETTPLEQAISQAYSDWKSKHDDGYKTEKDLGIDRYDEVMAGETFTWCVYKSIKMSQSKALEAALPQFNTDASGNVKPMLAKAVNWDKVTYPCLVQPKLDGVRCLMAVNVTPEEDGYTWTVTFLSRSGKEYTTLKHIENNVTMYMYENKTPQSFILDGEIYSDELTFQEVIAAVKKQRPDSLKLKFHAYDVVNEDVQHKRFASTVDLVKAINSPLVTIVEHFTVSTREQVKMLHDDWVSKGNEGAMIRLLNGTYAQGQRSSYLLKVKEFNEGEFEFVRWERGQREEDLIAVLYHWPNGKDTPVQAFRAKMVGSKAQKEELIKETPSKGAKVTVKHFGWTDDGLPRFPIGKTFRNYE